MGSKTTKPGQDVRFVPCVACGERMHPETDRHGNEILACRGRKKPDGDIEPGRCHEAYVEYACEAVLEGKPEPHEWEWILEKMPQAEELETSTAELQTRLDKLSLSFEEEFPEVREARRACVAITYEELKVQQQEFKSKLLAKLTGGQNLSFDVRKRLSEKPEVKEKVDAHWQKGLSALQTYQKAVAAAKHSDKGRKVWQEIGGNSAYKALKLAERRLEVRKELEHRLSPPAAHDATKETTPAPSQPSTDDGSRRQESPKPKDRSHRANLGSARNQGRFADGGSASDRGDRGDRGGFVLPSAPRDIETGAVPDKIFGDGGTAAIGDTEAGSALEALKARLSASEEVNASSEARKLAEELDVDLTSVTGTGRNSQITVKDVRAVAK